MADRPGQNPVPGTTEHECLDCGAVSTETFRRALCDYVPLCSECYCQRYQHALALIGRDPYHVK